VIYELNEASILSSIIFSTLSLLADSARTSSETSICLAFESIFFSPVANGSQITAEDLQKVADILKGSFEGMEIVNQEYRFKFKMGI
jgi:hypothetical protein